MQEKVYTPGEAALKYLKNNQLSGLIPDEICNQGDLSPNLSNNQLELKFETGVYKEGKKIGEWTSWYKNRQKKYSAKYVNGLLSGNYIEWDFDGKKISDIQYKNGVKIQEYIVISNEDFIFEVNRVGGILEGSWKKMSVNSVLIEKGNFI